MRLLLNAMAVALSGLIALVGLVGLVWALSVPQLPEVLALTDYRPKLPLRVMTADGVLIGEFGEERRSVVRFNEVPRSLIDAILAAEDDRFFEHSGIDIQGIFRSAGANLLTASRAQGASTITMQVARNFYLSSDKTFLRKLYEVMLAFRIEQKLTKSQILELYINQIFLGRRAYGFASAAQIYFGKPMQRLTIAEAAMLAGLPKAPSAFNPVVNPRRAKARQEYILGRMRKLDMISDGQFVKAMKEQLRVIGRSDDYSINAAYLSEMVRQQLFSEFQEDAYSRGLTVFTTIRADEQRAAHSALRNALIEFDRRQGWRGPEGRLVLPDGKAEEIEDAVEDALSDRPDSDGLFTAVVMSTLGQEVRVMRPRGREFVINAAGLNFAAKGLDANAPADLKVSRGAIVRIALMPSGEWELTQVPQVEGAFVALQNDTGAVRALVGGFDFRRSKFNHVTQAYRQPGSTLKPFIYAAALERGYSGTTLINDAPVTFDPGITGGQEWNPKNYDGKYEGPISLRQALAKSKNMVSIRLLHAIGPRVGQNYLSRFGFESSKNPPYLTLALGAGGVTPMQMATGYTAFANGGYRVTPYFIDRVIDEHGNLLSRNEPARAGGDAPRIIDERYAFITHTLLQDVVRSGTARKALSLGRGDLGGKTGTTNDAQDAWFAGYHSQFSAVAWIGYDQPRSLGERETGGGLALPVWISFVAETSKRIAQVPRPVPAGVIRLNNEFYTTANLPGVGVEALGFVMGDVPSDFTPDPPASN